MLKFISIILLLAILDWTTALASPGDHQPQKIFGALLSNKCTQGPFCVWVGKSYSIEIQLDIRDPLLIQRVNDLLAEHHPVMVDAMGAFLNQDDTVFWVSDISSSN